MELNGRMCGSMAWDSSGAEMKFITLPQTPILFFQQDLRICNCSEQLDGIEKEQVAEAQTI